MHLKLKIGKTDTVYFDGTWVSNGYWMAKKEIVTLTDKELQALIDAGVHFSRRSYDKLQRNGDSNCPDFSAITKDAAPEKPEYALERTPWILEHIESGYPTSVDRVLAAHEGSRLVSMRNEYDGFCAGDMFQEHSSKPIAVYAGAEEERSLVAIVMPTVTEWSRYLPLLQGGAQ